MSALSICLNLPACSFPPPYRVPACDHLVAILELDTAAIHFPARRDAAELAFAILPVPVVYVGEIHDGCFGLFE